MYKNKGFLNKHGRELSLKPIHYLILFLGTPILVARRFVTVVRDYRKSTIWFHTTRGRIID